MLFIPKMIRGRSFFGERPLLHYCYGLLSRRIFFPKLNYQIRKIFRLGIFQYLLPAAVMAKKMNAGCRNPQKLYLRPVAIGTRIFAHRHLLFLFATISKKEKFVQNIAIMFYIGCP